jgi:hypothetical protein
MINATLYRLDTVRRGAPGQPFGWQVVRRDDGREVERSRATFRSRHEAMADGTPAVIAWESGRKQERGRNDWA